MSGVAVIRHLCANNASLIASVPASRITAGVLPLGTDLPAISVLKVSSVQRKTVSMAASSYYWTERVQVTVMAKTYPAVNSIMALVRAACPVSHGTVNGFNVQSVLIDSEGPDFYDPDAVIYSQSLDFLVSYLR